MDIIETKTIDMLTTDSVSILTQKFVEIDGVNQQVGNNHRCSYQNSVNGRKALEDNEPTNVIASILAIWGDTPTIVETEVEVEPETEVEKDTLS